MMLDLRFSVDYYLRVIELAIRDESRILIYDKKQLLLEAWPRNHALFSDQDSSFSTIEQAIQEVFSRTAIPYSISRRLLSIIDVCLRQEKPYTRIFYRLFRRETYENKKAVVSKLLALKKILFFEYHRPVKKISIAADKALSKVKTNFSSWEDFSHDVTLPKTAVKTHVSVQENLAVESSSQVLMDALMAFLETRSGYQPLSLELLEQFISEKSIPLQILSEKNYYFLSQLKDLFLNSREDFQAIIGGILTDSLTDVLTNSLVGSQILTSQGKTWVHAWQEFSRHSPQDSVKSRGFLAEILRCLLAEALNTFIASTYDITPEQIGNLYSIRDVNPLLWNKMIRILLMRWLLDYDDKVYSLLRKNINYYTPHPTWRQYVIRLFKKY
ncbi:hypothetical protein CP10743SC13_0208 [Chlamydia psittaci 10_743_SC13]|nr:hypothetical protein CP10743SC13_0208 [Chlamydia psittaci 10_743_SC13]